MKKFLLVCLILSASIKAGFSWGNYSHIKINRLAIFLLPDKIKKFFEANMDQLADHAIDADSRKKINSKEQSRHYFAADHYGNTPFIVVPKSFDDAKAKYSEDTILKYGTLPWTIARLETDLTKAFSSRDTGAIMRIATDLGHYIADANAPLHCCLNSRGQLTGQVGIERLWESTLPELYSDKYNFHLHQARVVEDPLAAAWNMVADSYAMTDSVLGVEKQLLKNFPDDVKYTTIDKNGVKSQVLSDDFALGYHLKLHGMVEKQMRRAVSTTADFWFTAWLKAGKPDMTDYYSASQPVYFRARILLYEKMTRGNTLD